MGLRIEDQLVGLRIDKERRGRCAGRHRVFNETILAPGLILHVFDDDGAGGAPEAGRAHGPQVGGPLSHQTAPFGAAKQVPCPPQLRIFLMRRDAAVGSDEKAAVGVLVARHEVGMAGVQSHFVDELAHAHIVGAQELEPSVVNQPRAQGNGCPIEGVALLALKEPRDLAALHVGGEYEADLCSPRRHPGAEPAGSIFERRARRDDDVIFTRPFEIEDLGCPDWRDQQGVSARLSDEQLAIIAIHGHEGDPVARRG